MKRRSIFQGRPASPQGAGAPSGWFGLTMPLPPLPKGPPSQIEPPLPVLPPPPLVLDVPLAEEELDFGCGPSEEQPLCANIIEAASEKLVQ